MKKPVANNAKSTKKPGGITGKGFTPGKSGNPNGRPKSADFVEAVRDFLAEYDPLAEGDHTRLHRVLESLAMDDPKILLYYAFGKPCEMAQPKGQDDAALSPITVQVVGGSLPEPKRTGAGTFDPSKLSVEEMIQLKHLMTKAEGELPPELS
jgi:hypothetical protein